LAHPVHRPTARGRYVGAINVVLCPVVKLLSKKWWILVGERLEGPKLEPEGPNAEVRFPTAD